MRIRSVFVMRVNQNYYTPAHTLSCKCASVVIEVYVSRVNMVKLYRGNMVKLEGISRAQSSAETVDVHFYM